MVKKYIKPIRLGSLLLSSNIIYSPLAGCSDYPFRQMAAQYRPGLFYCEMVKMDALVRHDKQTYRLLDYDNSMHPIGAQICGSKPNLARISAKIIEELGFDIVDLNCGCPVDKVTKDGSGSGMLKNPSLIGDVIAEMVAAVQIPVTVKIRTGWDDNHIYAPAITEIAERAGAKAIAIHGRTRVQKYTGKANWNHIRDCKKRAKKIKVMGNGDVFDPYAALKLFAQTDCDAILLSRGTLGSPWIVENIRRLDAKEPMLSISGKECQKELLRHLDFITSYQREKKAVLDLRRVGCWYLRRGNGTKKLRQAINQANSLAEIRSLIEGYEWEQTSFSSREEETTTAL